MFHYIRDCKINDRGGLDNGGMLECIYGIYHFMRVAGWKSIWECDGYGEHLSDGDMEEDNLTYWNAQVSANLAKDTTTVHMGYRSLEVESTAAGSGVRSNDFVSIQTNQTYRVRLWALNNTGRVWTVKVNRPNDGVVTVGTIPSDGVWAEYEFSFTSDSSSGSSHWIQITDEGWSNVNGTIYLDQLLVYRSFFEYNLRHDAISAADGVISTPDQFSAAGYSFTVADQGRYVAVWDPTNLGNSGLYQISTTAAGVATLDLRSSGASPTLTAATGLKWRLIDIAADAPWQQDPENTVTQFCGFGLESPHAEKWRMFMRANWNTSGDYTWVNLWTSPYDADFGANGDFAPFEASTHDTKSKYNKNGGNSCFTIKGRNPGSADSSFKRVFFMTDDDGSFISPVIRSGDGSVANDSAGGFAGFTGVDSYHTLRESFCVFFPSTGQTEGTDDISFGDTGNAFSAHGAQCGDVGKGWMTRSTIMTLGYGGSSSDELDYTTAMWRTNPYDSKWWLRKPRIARDYVGEFTNNPTEKDMDGVGMFHGPEQSLPYTTIDSNEYLYIMNGWYWDWWSGHEMLA